MTHINAGLRPCLTAPPGACDTHMHVFDARFTLASTALVTPPPAPASDYLALRDRLGISRSVVVQPSGYAFDNACTLDAVAQIGESGRAVVTIRGDEPDDELERLGAGGARGVRFHMLPGGVMSWDQLLPVANRIQPLGWHVQVQLDGRFIAEREDLLRRLPGTLVIDHVGKFLEPVAPSDPAFRILLDLVSAGRTYVKLSAPYETSKTGRPGYEDVGALAKELVRASPERMLWASNWPHLGQPADRYGDEAELLDLLLDWAPDESIRRRILVDNPARLYGFGDA